MQNCGFIVTILFLAFTSPVFGAKKKVFKNIYRKTSAVVYSKNCLIGGTENGIWVEPQEAASFIQEGDRYKIFTLTKNIGEAVGETPCRAKDSCSYGNDLNPLNISYKVDFSTIIFSNSFYNSETEYLAVSCDWNPMPRKPQIETVVSAENRIYGEEIKNILKKKGFNCDKEKSIKQIIKTDFEGDGINEVLITAVSSDRITENGKFYSAIVIFSSDNVKCHQILTEGDYPDYENPEISFVIDADGDGVMEIFIDEIMRDKRGIEVFKIKNKKAEQIYSSACCWK